MHDVSQKDGVRGLFEVAVVSQASIVEQVLQLIGEKIDHLEVFDEA